MPANKAMQAYVESEKTNIAEGNDPLAVVALLFDELIRAMEGFARHSDKKTGKKETRSEKFGRSLTLIYALQTSLNFEDGGEIANNLFSLYEYSRQQLLKDWQDQTGENTLKAIEALDEIRQAWHELNKRGE